MNILTTELEYQMTFHIVPQVTVRLGKSWGVTLNWLNFELEVKHISTDFCSKHTYLFSPFVTLHSYPDSAYRLTFEFNWLGYTFRRGIWLIDGEEPRPTDNTPGFVTSKYDRGRADAKDVITELADVSIMVEQMAMLFGKEEFEAEKERKLKRLQEKINEAS